MIFLNIGKNKSIKNKDIIGIFDMDNTTVSQNTRKFLSINEKNKTVISATDEIPKSYIVCRENGKIKIYFSQFSSSALYGRSENNN